MEHHDETTNDKKLLSRAKSSGPPSRLRGEKRAVIANEVVKSLDLAMGKLKKGKIISSFGANNSQSGPLRRGMAVADMFMDTTVVPSNTPGTDNGSHISLNFSHYELMRNLSRSNNSEGAFSDTTNTSVSSMDTSMKREHLERYFRSVEMWNRRRNRDGSSSVHSQLEQSDK